MLTKPTPRFVAIQSSYWACYCCIISFSSVYLLDQGFSNAQVGLVISLGGLLSALLQPRVSRAAASWCWSSCSCPSALPWAWPA